LLRHIIFPPILLQGLNFRNGLTASPAFFPRNQAGDKPIDPAAMTAAHRAPPFGTEVTVINHDNGRSAVVRINDRSPFAGGEVIDLSPGTALALSLDGLASLSPIDRGAENASQK
jgi:rare lipoprotein A